VPLSPCGPPAILRLFTFNRKGRCLSRSAQAWDLGVVEGLRRVRGGAATRKKPTGRVLLPVAEVGGDGVFDGKYEVSVR